MPDVLNWPVAQGQSCPPPVSGTVFVRGWKLWEEGSVSSFGSCVLSNGVLGWCLLTRTHAVLKSPFPKPAGNASELGPGGVVTQIQL